MNVEDPPGALEFTGERFILTPGDSEISLEHVHRYLMAAELCPGAVVLDAACGSGYGTAMLGACAKQAFGVDIDAQAVAYAERKFAGPNVSYRQSSVVDLPFDEAFFDVVVSFETLEHLAEQEQMLAEFRRVLKPEGRLIISTPDKPVYNAALAEPNPFHVRELTRAEFADLLKRRFRNVEFYGQRVAFGSLTVAEHGVGPMRAIRRLDATYDPRDAYGASMYIIAACSDGPLTPLPSGIYEGGIPQNAISSLLGGIAERDQLVGALTARFEQLQDEAQRLEREQLALKHEVQRQQRLLSHSVQALSAAARLRCQLAPRLLLGDLFVAARRRRLRPRSTMRIFREIRLIRASGLLDAQFYAPQKARTILPAMEDARNYVLVGRELDPSPLFSGSAYLRLNPDLQGQEITPLGHYIQFGAAERRRTEPPADGGAVGAADSEA